jgi:O-antigen ligase
VQPRIGTWKGSWHAIVNSPLLGHGLDVYSGVSYVDPYNNVAEETHDFLLMGWYQGGFFFLVGELICIAEGFRRMLVGRKRHPTRNILLAGGVTVILFALQAPMLFDRYFWFPFVLATAYPMLPSLSGRRQVELVTDSA